MTDVTVIGLGQMGFAIASLLLRAGKSVTVWNRSAEKSAPLAAAGARVAVRAADAIAASPLVLLIVSDHEAAVSVLASDGASLALEGRTVVDLGTAGPDEVRRLGEQLLRANADYLNAAIQAAPSQMGEKNTPILVSGPRPVFDAVEPVLGLLGGSLTWLGEPIEGAAFMDLATLSFVYGSFGGFLQGALLAEANDLDVRAFGGIVRSISPSFGAFFAHEADVIAGGDFAITESPMRISIPAVDRIVRTSERLGLDAQLPRVIDGRLAEARCVRPRERGTGCADQGAAPPDLGQSRALRDQRNLRDADLHRPLG